MARVRHSETRRLVDAAVAEIRASGSLKIGGREKAFLRFGVSLSSIQRGLVRAGLLSRPKVKDKFGNPDNERAYRAARNPVLDNFLQKKG